MKRNPWSPIFNDPGEPSGVSPGILAIRSQFLHRVAFTLLETILALSLSALLLGAIYAAIEQSWRTASSGREEMERAQLARALIHKIEVDIRAITFVPPPPVEDTAAAGTTTSSSNSGSGLSSGGGGSGSGGSNSGGGGNSSGGSSSGSKSGSSGGNSSSGKSGGSSGSSGGSKSGGSGSSGSSGGSSGSSSFGLAASSSSNSSSSASSSSTDSTTTDPPVPNSKSMGIRGTTQKFEISIARPRRDLLPGTGTTTTARTSDLRQVSYSFLPPGSSPSGLIRTEGDRMAVETLETSGGTATQISSVQMLAPEVSAFHVRYFDGRIWSETWDTDTTGRIPRAVEVSIAFTPPRRKPPIFSVAVSRSMDSFRTVIVIPVSDPFPQDFVQ